MNVKDVGSAQLPKKTDPEEYDLVVLGSGTGSKVAAWTTAEQGKRVALIERKYIGGSCHNIACLAKISFTARRLRRTCAGVRSSASRSTASGSTCPLCVSGSGGWYLTRSIFMSTCLRRPAWNSSSGPDASSA